jgi:hypothetical protein
VPTRLIAASLAASAGGRRPELGERHATARRPRNDPGQYDDLAAHWWNSRGYFAMLHWLAHARGALIPSDAARLAASLVAVEVGAGVVHAAITVTPGGEHRQEFGGPGAWEFGGDAAVGSVEQPHVVAVVGGPASTSARSCPPGHAGLLSCFRDDLSPLLPPERARGLGLEYRHGALVANHEVAVGMTIDTNRMAGPDAPDRSRRPRESQLANHIEFGDVANGREGIVGSRSEQLGSESDPANQPATRHCDGAAETDPVNAEICECGHGRRAGSDHYVDGRLDLLEATRMIAGSVTPGTNIPSAPAWR